MAITLCRAAFLALAVITLSFLPALHAEDGDCVYTVYIRTGSVWRGGTESTISVEFYDASDKGFLIPNLTAWGGALQGPDFTHFERGALDIFSGLGKCLEYPICYLNLTSDGLGPGHGWYVNYVEVSATGAHLPCSQHGFEVERWIATDRSPYSLEYTADECGASWSRRPIRETTCGHSDCSAR